MVVCVNQSAGITVLPGGGVGTFQRQSIQDPTGQWEFSAPCKTPVQPYFCLEGVCLICILLYIKIPYSVKLLPGTVFSLFFIFYEMAIPPLAYPTSVFTRESPVAVMLNTINSLSLFATGIDNPVTVPELIWPMLINPVKLGVKVTAVPAMGRKVLFGVAELYSCA